MLSLRKEHDCNIAIVIVVSSIAIVIVVSSFIVAVAVFLSSSPLPSFLSSSPLPSSPLSLLPLPLLSPLSPLLAPPTSLPSSPVSVLISSSSIVVSSSISDYRFFLSSPSSSSNFYPIAAIFSVLVLSSLFSTLLARLQLLWERERKERGKCSLESEFPRKREGKRENIMEVASAAAALPVPSGNNTNDDTPQRCAKQILRDFNKPRCIQCGNVASKNEFAEKKYAPAESFLDSTASIENNSEISTKSTTQALQMVVEKMNSILCRQDRSAEGYSFNLDDIASVELGMNLGKQGKGKAISADAAAYESVGG
ncbi:hypothetical protein ACLOJK_029175 [Asimina triloba]